MRLSYQVFTPSGTIGISDDAAGWDRLEAIFKQHGPAVPVKIYDKDAVFGRGYDEAEAMYTTTLHKVLADEDLTDEEEGDLFIEQIEHEPGNPEAWICICKNTPSGDGFYPCLEDGREIEPTAGGPWDGIRYLCNGKGCGRIINQDTLQVLKRVEVEYCAICAGFVPLADMPEGDICNKHYKKEQ